MKESEARVHLHFEVERRKKAASNALIGAWALILVSYVLPDGHLVGIVLAIAGVLVFASVAWRVQAIRWKKKGGLS